MPTELLNPTTVEVTDSVGIHHGPVGAREEAHDGAQEHVPPLQDVRGVVGLGEHGPGLVGGAEALACSLFIFRKPRCY